MNYKELIARLRVGAGIERERVLYIGWSPLANEAADAIESLQATATEYQQAADKMAMEHKVERDTLRQQLAEAQALIEASRKQEPAAWITPNGEGFRIRFSKPTTEVPLGWYALYAALAPQAEPKACNPLCELCVKRRYSECAKAAKTTPIVVAQQAGWVQVPITPTQEMIFAGRTTPMPSESEFGMNTIDNIMALADEYAESYRDALAPNVNALVDEAKTALRTALTEALAAQPVREPLTDEQIGMAFRKVFPVGGVVFTNGATEFARAIECAHGIEGDK